jgi:hypothetical protein
LRSFAPACRTRMMAVLYLKALAVAPPELPSRLRLVTAPSFKVPVPFALLPLLPPQPAIPNALIDPNRNICLPITAEHYFRPSPRGDGRSSCPPPVGTTGIGDQRLYETSASPFARRRALSDLRAWLAGANDSATLMAEYTADSWVSKPVVYWPLK